MDTDVLVIGGGLAGLALAERLHQTGRSFMVVEARDRFGGRIKTQIAKGGYFDMGPAWFWPDQPRIAALISRLGLERFDQHYQGDLIYEDETGEVQRGRGYASMQGSHRLEGGLQMLTDGLAERLPDGSKSLNAKAISIARTNSGATTTLENGQTFTARHVVLALPPRLVAEQVSFSPPLPETAMQQMTAIPTWMAGQAKAVAVYETCFWRDAGLSGDAMSRCGPLAEIHDASPRSGGPYALFGFVGLPAQSRHDVERLKSEIRSQLTRLFGPKAATPTALYVKDWAFDPNTATKLDHRPAYAHPQYGLPQSMDGLWDQRLHFGGTEVAVQFGGYLEGALEAAENVLSRL